MALGSVILWNVVTCNGEQPRLISSLAKWKYMLVHSCFVAGATNLKFTRSLHNIDSLKKNKFVNLEDICHILLKIFAVFFFYGVCVLSEDFSMLWEIQGYKC